MYSNPYNYGGNAQDALGALAGFAACAGVFTLIFVVLYLWLFYRIFEKAGYSGWYTLLNLIPYIGSVIVVFMLAFGDWPMLRRQAPPTYGPPGGYPGGSGGYGTSGGGYGQGSGGYVPPVSKPQGGYEAPPPPAPQPPVPPVGSGTVEPGPGDQPLPPS